MKVRRVTDLVERFSLTLRKNGNCTTMRIYSSIEMQRRRISVAFYSLNLST